MTDGAHEIEDEPRGDVSELDGLLSVARRNMRSGMNTYTAYSEALSELRCDICLGTSPCA